MMFRLGIWPGDFSNNIIVQVLYCLTGAALAGLFSFTVKDNYKAFFQVLISFSVVWWFLKYYLYILGNLDCGNSCTAGTSLLSTVETTLPIAAVCIIIFLLPALLMYLQSRTAL